MLNNLRKQKGVNLFMFLVKKLNAGNFNIPYGTAVYVFTMFRAVRQKSYT